MQCLRSKHIGDQIIRIPIPSFTRVFKAVIAHELQFCVNIALIQIVAGKLADDRICVFDKRLILCGVRCLQRKLTPCVDEHIVAIDLPMIRQLSDP